MQEALTLELVFAVIAAAGVIYGVVKGRSDGSAEVLNRLTRLETKMDLITETAFKRIDELKSRDDKLEQKIEKFHE